MKNAIHTRFVVLVVESIEPSNVSTECFGRPFDVLSNEKRSFEFIKLYVSDQTKHYFCIYVFLILQRIAVVCHARQIPESKRSLSDLDTCFFFFRLKNEAEREKIIGQKKNASPSMRTDFTVPYSIETHHVDSICNVCVCVCVLMHIEIRTHFYELKLRNDKPDKVK